MIRLDIILILLFFCATSSLGWGSTLDLLEKIKENNSASIQNLSEKWVDRGGLELITGGPSSSNTESRWGHTSVRFFGSSDNPIEDIVVEAVALNNSQDGTIGLIYKGLSGGYPAILNFKTVGDQIRYYYHKELRGYTRTIIPTTKALRENLLRVLDRVNRADSPESQYYFLSNNCTSYMARLLNESGLKQLELPYPFLPKQANIHYRRSYLSPWPEMKGLSIEFLKQKEKDLENKPVTDFSTIALQQLLVFSSASLGEKLIPVVQELDKRDEKASSEQVYGLEALPLPMYQRGVFLDQEDLGNAVSGMFTKKEIRYYNMYNRAAWNTTYGHRYCSAYKEQCDYFKSGMDLLISLD